MSTKEAMKTFLCVLFGVLITILAVVMASEVIRVAMEQHRISPLVLVLLMVAALAAYIVKSK